MGRNASIEHFTTTPHQKQNEYRRVPNGKTGFSHWRLCVYVLRAESLGEIKLVNRRFISAKNPLKRTKKSLSDLVLTAHSAGLYPLRSSRPRGQHGKCNSSPVTRTGSDKPKIMSSSLSLGRAAGHGNRVGPIIPLAPPSLPQKGLRSELRENAFRNV